MKNFVEKICKKRKKLLTGGGRGGAKGTSAGENRRGRGRRKEMEKKKERPGRVSEKEVEVESTVRLGTHGRL